MSQSCCAALRRPCAAPEDEVKLEESEDEDKLEKESEDKDKLEKESEDDKVDQKSKKGCSSK